MKTEIVKITPAVAKKLLEKNTGNFRKPDKSRVTHYANEMRLGRWAENGDTIKVSTDNVLLDGQHRLMAVVESGVTIQGIVVSGILEVAAATMDRGRPRTIAQWLQHNHLKNANAIASIVRQILIHNTGYWAYNSVGVGIIPESQMVDFAIVHHAELQQCLLWRPSIPGVRQTLVSAMLYIATQGRGREHSPTADWFFDVLNTGENLTNDDPVFHLRNRLIQSASSKMKLTPHMIKMLATIAWNKTALDESCTPYGLTIRLTGPSKTQLPETVLVAPDLR